MTTSTAATLPAVTSIHFACGLLPLALVMTATTAGATVDMKDARIVRAEIETFNNAEFVGRTAVTVDGARTRAFMFRATEFAARGIARGLNVTVYSLTGGTYIAF